MNVDRKSLVILLLIALALLLLAGLAVARESPRFKATKIPSLFIAKNWPFNQIDSLTLSGDEFTCQPNDGKQWACEVMLEGKRLEMTASYTLTPYQSLTSCAVLYGGTPYACEVTTGYNWHGWNDFLEVNTDMGISAARMAELRDQRPLTYMSGDTWIGLGVVWATGLTSLIMLLFLTLFNKVPYAEFMRMRLPVWLLCLIVIVVALPLAASLLILWPIGLIASVVLLLLAARLNQRDRKQGPSLAHPVMWASVSVVALWIINFMTLFGLMSIGFVD